MDVSGGLIGLVSVIMVFGSIVAIVALPMYFRERTKQSAHRLISEAISKGQTLDPALMERLTEATSRKQQSSPRRTLGSAVVMLALGGAFFGASYLGNDVTGGIANDGMMKAALILGCLGAAFLVLAIVDYLSQKKTGA